MNEAAGAAAGGASGDPESDVVVVLSTFPTADAAGRVGRELVERRLAACVNLVPGVRSIYRWQGAIEDAEEVLAIVKTRRARLALVIAALSELHPYDTPEILALPVAAGARLYTEWVRAETS